LFSCAVLDDRSKNVAGTWIRFMTRLATEMGMVLAFPKRRPSTETPIKALPDRRLSVPPRRRSSDRGK
jgi:hypothetical protein